MLVVNRPAEVLNFEQKQLLAMVVFFYFYAVIDLDWYAYITAKLFASSVLSSHIFTCTLIYSNFIFKMFIYLQISTTVLFKVNLCLNSKETDTT